MASAVKLLLVNNSSDSTGFQVTSLSAPDASGSFGSSVLESYVAKLPSSNLTGVAPSIAWDSTNGDVLITFANKSNGWLGLTTLRPGRSLGELDWVGNGYRTNNPPSSLFFQNGPLVAYRWQNNNAHSVVWRSTTWLSDGTWTAQNATIGPSNTQVSANNAPVLCRVGGSWIYSFYFGGNSPSNSPSYIYYNVIDPTGLSRGPVNGRNLFWNSYYTLTALSNSQWTGVPAVVVTGSSSTDRKIHIFALNTGNDLHYFYIPLQANGLPQVSSNDPTNRRVDCSGEEKLVNTSGSPISAVTYNGNLYVFYAEPTHGIVSCLWRPTDGTSAWTTGRMPNNITVGTDAQNGGVSALFVQADF